MNGLLNGINVLDFGRAAVGPWAASLLGSMGANVIRVESPDGDAMVIQRPLQRGYGVAYTIYNANKKGLILDLKSPDSKPHLRRLVEKADLIIENLTPGALERIGAGYDAAKAMNPNIVYASCPGWGYTGPIKDLAAGDPDFQAFSGFASLNGDEGGKMEMFRHPYPLDLHAGILFASTAPPWAAGPQQNGPDPAGHRIPPGQFPSHTDKPCSRIPLERPDPQAAGERLRQHRAP